MFAAVRASRAIKRSSGRRKGRGKLLHCSTFNGPKNQSQACYHDVASDPQLQTSSSLDNNYTQIAPFNSVTTQGGRAYTYVFQFILADLPLALSPGTNMLLPSGMLKFHAQPGAKAGVYTTAWHNMPTQLVEHHYGSTGSGRFRRNYSNYYHYQWMLYCVAGSTIQQAKYRLVPELIRISGTYARTSRYITAPLNRFRARLRASSDQTCKAAFGRYTYRGYGSVAQGRNVWFYGAYNVGQGYQRFSPYGYQLDLTFMGAPGKFIEWRRQ